MEAGKRELSPSSPTRVAGHSGPDDHHTSADRSDRRHPRCSPRSAGCSSGSAGSDAGRELSGCCGPLLSGPSIDASRQRSASSPPAAAVSNTQRSDGQPRLQSVVVGSIPPHSEEVDGSNCHPWITVTSRHGRRGSSPSLLDGRPPMPPLRSSPNGARHPARSAASVVAREAFLRRFRGRCFRCLSRDHRRSACRDPPRCIECWAWGHRASESQRCKAKLRRAPVHSRLVFPPRPSAHLRLRFPAPQPSPAMIGQIQARPAPRRPGHSHTVIMASRAVEHQIFSLRSKGVLAKAVDGPSSATPLSIGKEIEAALQLPPHLLRVTKHYPEDFFIHFDVPNHRDKAVRRGSIVVDGTTFLLQAWRESEHGVIQTYNLHARVCIEKMPLHLWSIEGAREVLGKDVIVNRLDSRTYAQDNTKLFSCWVWCWSLDRIPGNHGFTVFPKGSGSIEEMNGFSPPSRVVPPAPEGVRFDALIHIDLVEDWTVREARTPSSRQSGMPSSSSDEEPPFPAVQPYTWHFGVPDGEEVRSSSRRRLLDVCNSGPSLLRRDDRGDDGGDHHRRGGQDSGPILRREGAAPPPSQSQRGMGGTRRRSRTPTSRQRHEAEMAVDANTTLPPPPPLPMHGPLPQRIPLDGIADASPQPAPAPVSPASPASALSGDPLVGFMIHGSTPFLSWPSLGTDPMTIELEAFCNDASAKPMSFPPSPGPLLSSALGLGRSLGLAGPASPPGALGRLLSSPPRTGHAASPSPLGPGANSEFSSVVCQVAQLELSVVDAPVEGPPEFLDMLFAAPPSSILGASPPSPPPGRGAPKDKVATPSRRSVRQASLSTSTIPVAQRATLRLAKELNVIADDEQRLEAAVAAITGHLKGELDEVDIDGLALLTRIDKEAIVRAAAKASSTAAKASNFGAAMTAH